ncbi:bacterio-opsin activator domain-containing protein [Halopiger goleimassiliensis]|uniref:bacterio-opsin activator domain-containing protein n=1 Tax=Halopiger goleimassiliensis TaxID=1293048 RepID=UPI000677847D|nr:bacterio-opsin activator domain-containing protein [Halopiger goleimassiliensis]
MSDRNAVALGDDSRVLIVGTSPRMDATADALESVLEPESVLRSRTVANALDRLADGTVRSVVCEFDPDSDESPLQALSVALEEVPILAVTDAADRALERGASDVVAPDESPRVLATRVSNVVRGWTADGERDRRSRSILANASAVVCVLESDGTIAEVNPAVERRFGYTPAELEWTPLSRLVHPEDREALRETLESVASAAVGETETTSLRVGRTDGTWVRTEVTAANRLADPAVEGIVATVAEVPAADDDGLETAIDRLPVAVFTLGSEWELRSWNDAAEDLFVGDPEPGAVVWQYLPETVRNAFYDRLRGAAATDSVVRFGAGSSTDDGYEVTAGADDDGITVVARSVSADESLEAGLPATDRDRLALLESVVDALEDGIAVLDGSTIQYANGPLSTWAGGDPLVGRDLESVFDADLAETIRERTASTVVRWMEPVRGRLEVGGATRPVAVFVAPLPGDERTCCIVRDARRSSTAALSTLRDAIDAFDRADTRADVRRAAVDEIYTYTDADVVGWYLVDGRLLRPAAVATSDDADAPTIEYDATPLVDLLEDDAGTALEDGELRSVLSRAGVRAERAVAVSAGDHGVVVTVSADPFAAEELETEPLETVVESASLALDRLESRDRVQRCRRELSRVETVATRAERIRDLEREVLEADRRDRVERHLCEGVRSLLAGDAAFAWVGHVDTGTETVSPVAWAGTDEDRLESASIPVAEDATDPTGRTAARRELTVVDDLGSSELAPGDPAADWLASLREAGVRSALGVPIEADGFQFGVLTIYATDPGAFDDRLQRAVHHLATVAGHAIGSLERTQALLAESTTELELALRDAEPLSAAVRHLDRPLEVRAIVPRSSGGSTVYGTVSNADEGAVETLPESIEAVESARVVDDAGDGTAIELRLSESSVAEPIAARGGRLRSLEPSEGHTRLVVDVPGTVDVRSFLDALAATYPRTELVARRERERSIEPARPFDASVHEHLSERQLRTLETAYHGGFFAWPRESTGEEIADSLGVSQPTFSRHLRTAQRKLLELLFDERQAE